MSFENIDHTDDNRGHPTKEFFDLKGVNSFNSGRLTDDEIVRRQKETKKVLDTAPKSE